MDLEQLTKIVEEQGKKIDALIEKMNELKKTPRSSNRETAKNIPFEEAFMKCKKATSGEEVYPCMYLPKSGKNKGKCCGNEAVFVDNEEGEQVRIKEKVGESFFHSLRCNACQNKGRANSESKKLCNQKIKGIDVKSSDGVNEKALSFLSGNTDNVTSPSRAFSKEKLPTGNEIEYDDYFHYLVPHDGNCFVFEYDKNKSGTPCIKKTPTLKGFLEGEKVDEDEYEDKLKKDIPEKIFNDLKNRKRFKFDGVVIKIKKEEPIVPRLEEEEEDDDEDKLDNSEMEKILEDLDVE